MKNNEEMLFNPAFSYKLIYIFRINDEIHSGKLKIGEATIHTNLKRDELIPNSDELNSSAKNRINDYTSTAGIKYELLHTELAVTNNNKSFKDKDVHDVLERSGYKRFYYDTERKQNEWFVVSLEVAKSAIKAVKEGRKSLTTDEKIHTHNPIILRPEQEEAVNKTIKQFNKSNSMLWNAKMRFGKTISALELTRRQKYNRTIIITHRPVVDEGWYDDFGNVFYGTDYRYGSKRKGESLENLLKSRKPFVYFASIQDLRGSTLVGGKFEKDELVFNTDWDFVIIDEAHEGTKTEKGVTTIEGVVKINNDYTTKILKLSGTAFNLLEEFDEDDIYTWDYIMEQEAKRNWNLTHFGDPNPYADLPELNIYTYDLNKLIPGYKAVYDTAFNFREFFRVWTGDIQKDGKELPGNEFINDFVHKEHVRKFLDMICKENDNNNFPFSKESYRDYFRHSLWIVPGVKEARALSKMLQEHPVFGSGLFKIINIAGDGDEEVYYKDALKAVQDGIGDNPEDTYTITLSCGKLTTGVTVKPWTAVLYLAGSYSTQASSYLQTIFRVQSPANIGGQVKEKCYVFDFAPDRSLKMIASATRLSIKAGDTSNRTVLGKFLNFCPVISINGSRMLPYNVESMMGQLKKAYAERVASNGFDDKYIYNDNLFQLDENALEKFKDLERIVGISKQTKKVEKIDINNQGFTAEQYEQLKQLEKKKKKELTEEEKRLREELLEKRKQAGTAISILRGISIRIPLLIYGANMKDNEDITIDNLTDIVDDISWNEFMPKGVTKSMFKDFSKYYDQDIFIEAGRKIRRSAKYADTLSPTDRVREISNIFSSFRNPDKETVLTPWQTVNMHMSDTIGGYSFFEQIEQDGEYTIVSVEAPVYKNHGYVTQDVLNNTSSKILEINSKSGLYPLYVTYSLYRQKCLDYDEKKLSEEIKRSIWNELLDENIFVLCKTPMAKLITERTLRGYSDVKTNIVYNEHLIEDIENNINSYSSKVLNASYWSKGDGKMNFEAIVGNPPYQIMDGGAQSSAKPVYHLFVDLAKKLNPSYVSMIIPSRWFAGGKGLDSFRDTMLNDKNIRLLHDYLDASVCFPGVEIKGGVSYFLREKDSQGKCLIVTHQKDGKISKMDRYLKEDDCDVFIRYNEAIEIVNKIKKKNFKSFSDIVNSRKPFGMPTNFKDYNSKQTETENIKLYANHDIGYINVKQIDRNKSWVDKWKVYVPEAIGSGDTSSDRVKPILGKPGTACTETYLVIGPFETEEEAYNCIIYTQTRFFHYMLGLKKITQHTTSKVYSFVPMENFKDCKEIDWKSSIHDIDQALFNKYNLTEEEANYIRETVGETVEVK